MGILRQARELRAKGAPVAWAMPPMFEYDSIVYSTGLDDDITRLDDLLNAKAAQGWRVHTCQRVDDIDRGVYFVLFDRIKREE